MKTGSKNIPVCVRACVCVCECLLPQRAKTWKHVSSERGGIRFHELTVVSCSVCTFLRSSAGLMSVVLFLLEQFVSHRLSWSHSVGTNKVRSLDLWGVCKWWGTHYDCVTVWEEKTLRSVHLQLIGEVGQSKVFTTTDQQQFTTNNVCLFQFEQSCELWHTQTSHTEQRADNETQKTPLLLSNSVSCQTPQLQNVCHHLRWTLVRLLHFWLICFYTGFN